MCPSLAFSRFISGFCTEPCVNTFCHSFQFHCDFPHCTCSICLCALTKQQEKSILNMIVLGYIETFVVCSLTNTQRENSPKLNFGKFLQLKFRKTGTQCRADNRAIQGMEWGNSFFLTQEPVVSWDLPKNYKCSWHSEIAAFPLNCYWTPEEMEFLPSSPLSPNRY